MLTSWEKYHLGSARIEVRTKAAFQICLFFKTSITSNVKGIQARKLNSFCIYSFNIYRHVFRTVKANLSHTCQRWHTAFWLTNQHHQQLFLKACPIWQNFWSLLRLHENGCALTQPPNFSKMSLIVPVFRFCN